MDHSIYSAAIYAVFMVLALQVVLMALGLSDLEADVEADPTGGFDIPDDLESQSFGAVTTSAETMDTEVISSAASATIAGVLGLRGVPLLVWICFVLMGLQLSDGMAGVLRFGERSEEGEQKLPTIASPKDELGA